MRKYRLILATSFLVLSSISHGAPIDERQQNQRERISNGVASGELTVFETRRLAGQQIGIAKTEARYKSDGIYTLRERASIQNKQNRASGSIYKQKHDQQDRN